jgi:hypothetical protein
LCYRFGFAIVILNCLQTIGQLWPPLQAWGGPHRHGLIFDKQSCFTALPWPWYCCCLPPHVSWHVQSYYVSRGGTPGVGLVTCTYYCYYAPVMHTTEGGLHGIPGIQLDEMRPDLSATHPCLCMARRVPPCKLSFWFCVLLHDAALNLNLTLKTKV